MIVKPDTVISNRYRIISLIATGGMGQVWKARDTILERDVAMKVLKSEFSADPNFLTRFREEARTTARLNNPNIVSVYDYGEIDDTDGGDPIAFLVMELVHAESLSHALSRLTTLTVAQTLDMLSQTAQGLSAAHEEGIIHRDIKPGNILITPRGRVKVSDFGIAKAVDSVPITRTGTVMGTAQYLSPEQAVGKEATPASDVYSLGIVGYETLSGHRPFNGEGSVSAAMQHVTASPNPLPNTIPPNVRDLIAIALRKDPNARYRDGAEFARAISQVQAGNPAPTPAAMLNKDGAPAPTSNDADAVNKIAAAAAGVAAAADAQSVAAAPSAAAGQSIAAPSADAAALANAVTEIVPNRLATPQPGAVYPPTYGGPVTGVTPIPVTYPPAKNEGLTVWQVVLVVLGVLLVIGLIAYGAYFLLGRSDLPTNQPPEQPTITLTHTLTPEPDETTPTKSAEATDGDTPGQPVYPNEPKSKPTKPTTTETETETETPSPTASSTTSTSEPSTSLPTSSPNTSGSSRNRTRVDTVNNSVSSATLADISTPLPYYTRSTLLPQQSRTTLL